MDPDRKDEESASAGPTRAREQQASDGISSFHIVPLGEGLRELVFDRPGAAVNLLTLQSLSDLRSRLQDLAEEEGVRGVLLLSGKPGHFAAGTDVEELQGVRDAHEAQARLAEGQRGLQFLAELPVPTCAAIDELCVGSGMELALACRYRIGSDAAATRFALPEVRLGYMPALGGTTRLPCLIGMKAALHVLRSGTTIRTDGALELTIVDDVIHRQACPGRAAARFSEWIGAAAQGCGRRARRKSWIVLESAPG